MLFLSVDFGTSSVKVSVVDEALRELQTAKAPYPYVLLPGEKVEIDPSAMFSSLHEAVAQLDPQLRRDAELLCYDAFSPSPVFIDESGQLAYPNIVTHLDRRSRDQSTYIDTHFGRDRYLHITGLYPFTGGAGIMTLLWFMQNEDHYLDRTYRVGHLTTYLHKYFTGEWMVDSVNASMLGVYETVTQSGWSATLLDAFGLEPEWFGPIYDPGKVLGTLIADVAGPLGVRSGIPVTVGTNDMAASQMGAGNTEPGCILNTAGSSDMVSILTDNPVVSSRYYLRNAALPGLWQIYATTAGGFALDWFHQQFARELTAEDFYAELVPRALRTFEDEGDVTFDPYLTGDRQSLEKRTGAWHGLTLSATRDEMLVALLRSMNRVLYATITEASQIVELQHIVKLTGGLSGAAFLQLKEREIPGFTFRVVDNCAIIGSVALAQRYL
jgi:sugar (pentulose or hexulose) kinase